MNDWYFMEQQGVYRQQTLLGEAARKSIFAQIPHTGFRAQVAGALIAVAVRLAPSTTAMRLNEQRPLTGIVGS
jgi:hypothetical protein